MFIARTLGMTLREARQRIDSEEFGMWKAAYQVMPWGADWAGVDTLAWMTHAMNKSVTQQTLEAGHFIPKGFGVGFSTGINIPKEPLTKAPEPTQTPEQMWAVMDQFATLMGAVDV